MRVLSTFSGMGGFDEGLEAAGFDIIGAVDGSKFVIPNYERNFPDTPIYHGDVRDLLDSDWEEKDGSFPINDIDVLAGGPPCQGVSQIGPRDLDDDRNDLFEVFINLAKEYQPKLVLMENVPNIHKLSDGHYHKKVIDGLQNNGYSNVTRVNLHSEDYGIPQTRERAFYFGTRDDLTLEYELGQLVEALALDKEVEKTVSVWEAIGDLPAEVVESDKTMPYPDCPNPTDYQREMRRDYDGNIYSIEDKFERSVRDVDPDLLHNHHTKGIGDKRLKRIQHLNPGDNANEIPDELWDGARAEKYRRLSIDEPSHTLLAQMHRDLSEWVHPKEDRWISVREAMRLQSFHDGFVLGVSEWRMLQQIGNSVPPLLGKVVGDIANEVLQHSRGEDITDSTKIKVQSTLEGY